MECVSAHLPGLLERMRQPASLRSMLVYLALLVDAIQFAALPDDCEQLRGSESIPNTEQPLAFLTPAIDQNFSDQAIVAALLAPAVLLICCLGVQTILDRMIFVQLHRQFLRGLLMEVLRCCGYILYIPVVKVPCFHSCRAVHTPTL